MNLLNNELILIVLNCFFLATLPYPYFPECSIDPNVTVLTTLNGKVQGKCFNVTVNYGSKPKNTNQVMNWLSIPYAEPPLKNLKFKHPIPIQSWNSTLDGTKWPSKCLQEYGKSTQNNAEDCLYLNLFVPYNAYISKSRLPILIWIHGGSFKSGSNSEDEFEASTLVAMSNIIVVTINYRLGVYGFLHIKGTEAKGNQGILDQHLAMKWIYENANFFGGDNTRITLGGQSAGSWSVGYHLMYEPSWKYFRNAILGSGNPLELSSKRLFTSEEATTQAANVGKILGCYDETPAITNQELFECLQSKKVNETKYASSLFSYYPPVVLDGVEFNENPEVLFKMGKVKKANIISGSNSKDRAYFEKTSIKNPTSFQMANLTSKIRSYFAQTFYRYESSFNNSINDFALKLIDMYNETRQLVDPDYLDYYIQITTDQRYKCPAYELADVYSRLNVNTFAYVYGYRISTTDLPEKYEAVHRDELAMIFAEPLSIKTPPLISTNIWSSTKHNYSVEERLVSETIVRYWTNFVKNDNPNDLGSNVKWLEFHQSEENRNVFYVDGKENKMINHYANDLICRFFTTFDEDFGLTKARLQAWFSNYSELTSLSLSYRQLTYIEKDAFEDLSRIQVLILSENILTILEPLLFSNLSQLKILHLNSNKLKALDSWLFSGLNQLEMLRLDKNSLTSLNSLVFSQLFQLKEVNLSKNNLLTIDRTIFLGLNNLEKVFIGENPISLMQTSNVLQLCSANPKCTIYL